MARTAAKFSAAILISCIKAVEANGGLATLEALYTAVSRKYAGIIATREDDEFLPLSVQTIKKHIETLVSEGSVQIKTEPGRRSGGVTVDSKKDLILTGLNNLKTMVESGESEKTLAEIARIREIVESLHARKSKTDESAGESSESEEIVEPVMDEPVANAA